jgi:DNA replication protein DnaC
MTPRQNPFRVDRVTALPFLGADVPALALRFCELNQAALVGPHGAGKSTLLRSIGTTLAEQGHRVRTLTLPGSATSIQRRVLLRSPIDEADIVLLDGYEQLTRWQRYQARRRFRRLLVTAHNSSRSLPTLLTIQPTIETLHRVLAGLLGEVPPDLAVRAEAIFIRHHSDVRQTLFDLYDQVGK